MENCQPFTVQYKGGTIALAHNGNLVNYRELKKDLEADGRIFTSDSDTEVIAHLLVKELMRNDLVEAVRETMRKLIGSYSLVILIEDKIVGVRDPLGFKPLCIGRIDNGLRSCLGELRHRHAQRRAHPRRGARRDGRTRRPHREPQAVPLPKSRPLHVRVRLLRPARLHHGRPARLQGPAQDRRRCWRKNARQRPTSCPRCLTPGSPRPSATQVPRACATPKA